MYTSDKSALSKPLRGYLWWALGCAVFSAVYEHFSHGVYSWYMVFLFAVPLIYGLVPFLFSRTALSRRRSPAAVPLVGSHPDRGLLFSGRAGDIRYRLGPCEVLPHSHRGAAYGGGGGRRGGSGPAKAS